MSFKLFVFALAASVVTTGCDTMPASLTTDLPQAQAEAEAQKVNLKELIQAFENSVPWTLESISKITGTELAFERTTGVIDIYNAVKRQFIIGSGLTIDRVKVTVSVATKKVITVRFFINEASSRFFPRESIFDTYANIYGTEQAGGDVNFWFTTKKRPWGGDIGFVLSDDPLDGNAYLTEFWFDSEIWKSFKELQEESLAPPTYKLSLVDRVRLGLGMGL